MSRKSTLLSEHSNVNLIVGCFPFRYLTKSLSDSGESGQMHRTSSMYLLGGTFCPQIGNSFCV